MATSGTWLVLHGSIVLLIGLLCGAPYGIAINRAKPDAVVHGWRVAHGSLSLGGATLLVIGLCLALLDAPGYLKWGVSGSFALSGYSFALALPLGAQVGMRGLAWSGNARNKLVYLGNTLGAWSSVLGAVLLVAVAACQLL